MKVPEDIEFLTLRQAAYLLQMTPDQIYRVVRAGRIPSYTYGNTGNLRLKRSELFTPSRYSPSPKIPHFIPRH